MQLNNVLGRPNFLPPLIHEGDTNTHRGLNTRYDYLSDIMDEREKEIPALNRNPIASINHSTLISSQFLRASIQDEQEGQVVQTEAVAEQAVAEQVDLGRIDLSDSQVDLNSNITQKQVKLASQRTISPEITQPDTEMKPNMEIIFTQILGKKLKT